jgi:hypothetical protein
MRDALDALGVISEFLTWIGLLPGLVLLLVAWVMRRAQGAWAIADGVAFAAAGKAGYRWYDHRFQIQEALVPSAEALVPGTDVVVYYDRRNPRRWQLEPPPVAGQVPRILGRILTTVGLVSALAGIILLAV